VLLDIKKSDIQAYIMIRLNVSDENYDSVLNFISEYGVLFAFDKRFVMHFHPIFGMDNLKLSNLTEKVSNLKDVAAEYGLVSDNAYEEGVCYASKANNYVIRANGKLQKCTVALNDEINNIGRITPEGEMIIDEAKLNKWIHAEDKGCPLQSLKMEKLAVPYENAGKYV